MIPGRRSSVFTSVIRFNGRFNNFILFLWGHKLAENDPFFSVT